MSTISRANGLNTNPHQLILLRILTPQRQWAVVECLFKGSSTVSEAEFLSNSEVCGVSFGLRDFCFFFTSLCARVRL